MQFGIPILSNRVKRLRLMRFLFRAFYWSLKSRDHCSGLLISGAGAYSVPTLVIRTVNTDLECD